MDIKFIFLANLNEMVKDKGLSFRAFSLDIGINRRTMNRWSFDRSPRPESVIRIADYFFCSIDYLLDKADKPEFTPSKTKATFYERYLILKKRNGYNDSQVAKACDISPSTITNWKKGAVPDFEVLVALCNIFGCSFDYLVGRAD